FRLAERRFSLRCPPSFQFPSSCPSGRRNQLARQASTVCRGSSISCPTGLRLPLAHRSCCANRSSSSIEHWRGNSLSTENPSRCIFGSHTAMGPFPAPSPELSHRPLVPFGCCCSHRI